MKQYTQEEIIDILKAELHGSYEEDTPLEIICFKVGFEAAIELMEKEMGFIKYSKRKPVEFKEYLCRFTDEMSARRGAEYLEYTSDGFMVEHDEYFNLEWYKMKRELELIEFERGENYGHIKKFSLLEKSPTPILTTHTF